MHNKKYYKISLIIAILTLGFITGCTPKSCSTKNIAIIQKPIIFDKEREKLTKEYRLEHYGIKAESITIKPQMIVLHWTAMKDLQGAYRAFNRPTLGYRPELKKAGNLNVSVPFIVDRDGKIYQLMPIDWMARHTLGLNNIAIGIENVGGVNGQEDLTDAQVKANICLVKYLKEKYPSITYLIGHYEYGEFRNTALWQEKDKKYFTHKTDPGKKFMCQVRTGLGRSCATKNI